MKKLKELSLYSALILPLSGEGWLDLQYSDLKSNKVNLSKKSISIQVDKSASPLFYHFQDLQSFTKVSVEGSISIDKEIDPKMDDAYFQIGLIEKGDFKPGWLIRKFLPEWLQTLVNKNKDKDYGVGNIYFYGVNTDEPKSSEMKVKSLKLKFRDVSKLEKTGKLKIETKINARGPFAGVWLRSDGDDSEAVFKVEVSSIKFE